MRTQESFTSWRRQSVTVPSWAAVWAVASVAGLVTAWLMGLDRAERGGVLLAVSAVCVLGWAVARLVARFLGRPGLPREEGIFKVKLYTRDGDGHQQYDVYDNEGRWIYAASTKDAALSGAVSARAFDRHASKEAKPR